MDPDTVRSLAFDDADALLKLVPVEIALLAAYIAFLNFIPRIGELYATIDTQKLAKPPKLLTLERKARASASWIRAAIACLTGSLFTGVLFVVLKRSLAPEQLLWWSWYLGPGLFLIAAAITFPALWPWWALYLDLLRRRAS